MSDELNLANEALQGYGEAYQVAATLELVVSPRTFQIDVMRSLLEQPLGNQFSARYYEVVSGVRRAFSGPGWVAASSAADAAHQAACFLRSSLHLSARVHGEP